MNIRHVFHLSWINLSRRKKNTAISILLITLGLAVFIITLSFSSSLDRFINKNITNSVECRSMFVSLDDQNHPEDEIIEALSKYKHVAAAVPGSDIRQTLNLTAPSDAIGNNNGCVTVKGANTYTLPDVIKGKPFKDGESNVGIIPKKFLPDSNIELMKNKAFLDGSSLLGKTLSGKCGAYEYTFTVVGIYDSTQSMDDENVCYIPYKDMEEINGESVHKVSKDNGSTITVSGSDPIIVVDNYKNVQSVIKQLNKDGYQADLISNVNTGIGTFIGIVGGILAAVIFIVVLINISLTTLNSVTDRTQEIGLLKSIGYSNKLVLIMLNMETLIMGMIGFIISSALSYAFISFFSKYLSSNSESYISKISIKLSPAAILFGLMISAIIPAVSCIGACIRVVHIQPSDAMKE